MSLWRFSRPLTHSEEEYDKIKEEYETYMKEDKVCLYTYAGGYDRENLMAFRIVEVGRHDNSDGTKSEGALTFQARSASYKGAKMLNNENNTTWENSGVRKSLQKGFGPSAGAYACACLRGFLRKT